MHKKMTLCSNKAHICAVTKGVCVACPPTEAYRGGIVR